MHYKRNRGRAYKGSLTSKGCPRSVVVIPSDADEKDLSTAAGTPKTNSLTKAISYSIVKVFFTIQEAVLVYCLVFVLMCVAPGGLKIGLPMCVCVCLTHAKVRSLAHDREGCLNSAGAGAEGGFKKRKKVGRGGGLQGNFCAVWDKKEH